MWAYDAEALVGGVTVFTGATCGTVAKFLPGAQNSDKVGFAKSSDIKQSSMQNS